MSEATLIFPSMPSWQVRAHAHTWIIFNLAFNFEDRLRMMFSNMRHCVVR